MDKKSLWKKVKAIFNVKEASLIDEDNVDRSKFIGETQVNEILRREREATELLKNSVFIDTLNDLKKEFIRGWKDSHINEAGEREFYYLSYKILELFESRIKMVIEEAKVERLKRQETDKEM